MQKNAHQQKQPWFVLRYNHFDPIWRRCWDREFIDKGRRFVSYRAIEEAWISDAIEIAQDGVSCFMVESSWVLRHFLESHPEHVETLRLLTREGRFELLGSGENIVDANMIHGELLVRNLVLGTLWGEQVLGVRPATGWHSDGFGSSAQMPQIFRQCGYKWLPALDYRRPDAAYWRGLDGSTILFAPDAGGLGMKIERRLGLSAYPYLKHPPCPNCAGSGCEECENRGFPEGNRAELRLPDLKVFDAEFALLLLWGEELLPGRRVAEAIERGNAEADGIVIRQGLYRDVYPLIERALDLVDGPPNDAVASNVENNPSQSGCYVSRIEQKIKHRQAEGALLTAETWDALILGGANADLLRHAWKSMTLSAFHDAITGTHVDEAQQELLDLLGDVLETADRVIGQSLSAQVKSDDALGESVTIFNPLGYSVGGIVSLPIPTGWDSLTATANGKALCLFEHTSDGGISVLAPPIAPFGASVIAIAPSTRRVEEGDQSVVEAGPLRVTLGERGIDRIEVEGLGAIVNADLFLPGELVLEHDDGDPWATRTLDRTRERLSPYTHLECVRRDGDSVTISYTGKHPSNDNQHTTNDPNVTYLTWRQRFVVRAGVPWIEVITDVDWYATARRLRIAFPSTYATDTGVFDIPYGTLERGRYDATSTSGGNASGDWPAVHWAGIQTPTHTFAVFNCGTPSYRIENGTVLVSVLRSPSIPYALLEPANYSTSNYHGMEDGGTHSFHHAISCEQGTWQSNSTGANAELFNRPLTAIPGRLHVPTATWGIDATHTRVTALKAAEDGNGIVLRLVETAGHAETVSITPPPPYMRAVLCNLLEDDGEELTGPSFSVHMEPWKIVTLRLLSD